MIRMVVTDLDNTLLRSDKSISDYTRKILKSCMAKGIALAFATARSTQSAAAHIERVDPDFQITYGGALVSDREKTLFRMDIPPETSNALIAACLCEPAVSEVHVVHESAAWTNDRDITMKKWSHYRYNDFSQPFDHGFLKISIICPDEAATARLAAHFPECDFLRYTGEDLCRFASVGAVKWNAVQKLANFLGISTDSIAAFGDDLNDLKMLEKCGIGVAVRNAIEPVKAVADYICPSNDEDGVAKWLEEHRLK